MRECCELARDLDCPVVRILPAFIGYFWPIYWNQGYGNIAMHSRSLEVSKMEDYLAEWEAIREASPNPDASPRITASHWRCRGTLL